MRFRCHYEIFVNKVFNFTLVAYFAGKGTHSIAVLSFVGNSHLLYLAEFEKQVFNV